MNINIETLAMDTCDRLEGIIRDIQNGALSDLAYKLNKCHSESDALDKATDAFSEGDLLATIAFDTARLQLKED